MMQRVPRCWDLDHLHETLVLWLALEVSDDQIVGGYLLLDGLQGLGHRRSPW